MFSQYDFTFNRILRTLFKLRSNINYSFGMSVYLLTVKMRMEMFELFGRALYRIQVKRRTKFAFIHLKEFINNLT